ncbi:cytochrome-c oxidase, cbb3-type subunit III [Altericroceibacterium endophyticum]|uniref:Cbb3-type cytochrome c oxidase subunit n=1 Tax=Altericroceibacterium endophyticum TaxID=1808508 RepID=A0A6I4T4R8_9SPHN|nr:cytochrome-c oxidase, cbb3-type subunit III [Altericroceibacterium endophyticum]MXO65141.1 cytochrome-c oxidase, cbb3-type subunit III [Altericroceibacterium endophyticum]
MANKRIDKPTGTETVGHEWDGIEELNTPLPRWWLWTFYACIVFAIGYTIAYPAWPMVNSATKGMLGWTSHEQLAKEMAKADESKGAIRAALAKIPIERLPEDSELMRAAVAGGRAAFKVNCVQCHGAGAAGSKGYPNLNDDDWLWGGDLKAITYTLEHGVRQPDGEDTRFSMMPAFGADGILTSAQVSQVADHVLSLSGKAKDNAAGAQIFADNCAVCHGPNGKGMREFGAPNLTDPIWLYGGSREDVIATVTNSRYGVMPAWKDRLDPVTIKMLAAYVHSLGGGEDFVEVAEDPATEVDEQS